MGKANRGDLASRTDIPGPGTYEHALEGGNIGVVMGSSNRGPLTNADTTPGPGTYQASTKPHGPEYTMTGRKHDKEKYHSPGPGEYDPNSMHPSSPKYGLGSARRGSGDNLTGSFPGPGAYGG